MSRVAGAGGMNPRVTPKVPVWGGGKAPHPAVARGVGGGRPLPPQFRGHEIGEVQREVGSGAFLDEERLVPIGLSEAHPTASKAASNFATASGVWRPVVA